MSRKSLRGAACAVVVEHLAQHRDAVPLLAGWAQQQWGHLAPEITLEQRTAFFARRVTPGQIPEMLVAVANGRVVGMASIVTNDLSSRPDLTPWMAAVYVMPEQRGRGIGSLLVQAILAEARWLELPRLYLITPDKMAFYARLGWREMEKVEYRGELVTVMFCDL